MHSFFKLRPQTQTQLPSVTILRPSRTADEELEWFFTMAQSDMGARSNYLEMLMPARQRDLSGDDLVRRVSAARAHRRVLGWLRAIAGPSACHAGVLRAAYEARPWPLALREKLQRLTGVAVRLASADAGLPDDDRALDLLERETAAQLTATLLQKGLAGIEPLRARANAALAQAMRAYERERGGAPSVLDGWPAGGVRSGGRS